MVTRDLAILLQSLNADLSGSELLLSIDHDAAERLQLLVNLKLSLSPLRDEFC